MDHRVDPLPASERILTLDVVLERRKAEGRNPRPSLHRFGAVRAVEKAVTPS